MFINVIRVYKCRKQYSKNVVLVPRNSRVLSYASQCLLACLLQVHIHPRHGSAVCLADGAGSDGQH